MTTLTIRRIGFVALPLAALAVGGSVLFAGAAHADPLPVDQETTAMTVTDNTAGSITLAASSVDFGGWIAGPQQDLVPGQSEIVTAAGWNVAHPLTTNVTYRTANGTTVTFVANNEPDGANAHGTTTGGTNPGHLAVCSHLDSGAPHMNVLYDVYTK